MNEVIKKMDTAALWGLLADLSELLEVRGYKADRGNAAFMFWYQIYKGIELELDCRMASDFMEG